MKTHEGKFYITADDIPLGVVAATELDRLHKELGGTRGYGAPFSGQWLRVNQKSAERFAAVSTPPSPKGRTTDALWLTAESAGIHYYEGSAATGEELARKQYAFALGYYQARKGYVAIPYRIAQLVRNVFLPRNPNKLRNCTPEVVDAAKDFISRFERDADAKQAYEAHSAALPQVVEALKGSVADLEWIVAAVEDASDPKSERKISWKDIVLHLYAGTHRLPEYRSALAQYSAAQGKSSAQ